MGRVRGASALIAGVSVLGEEGWRPYGGRIAFSLCVLADAECLSAVAGAWWRVVVVVKA